MSQKPDWHEECFNHAWSHQQLQHRETDSHYTPGRRPSGHFSPCSSQSPCIRCFLSAPVTAWKMEKMSNEQVYLVEEEFDFLPLQKFTLHKHVKAGNSQMSHVLPLTWQVVNSTGMVWTVFVAEGLLCCQRWCSCWRCMQIHFLFHRKVAIFKDKTFRPRKLQLLPVQPAECKSGYHLIPWLWLGVNYSWQN